MKKVKKETTLDTSFLVKEFTTLENKIEKLNKIKSNLVKSYKKTKRNLMVYKLNTKLKEELEDVLKNEKELIKSITYAIEDIKEINRLLMYHKAELIDLEIIK